MAHDDMTTADMPTADRPPNRASNPGVEICPDCLDTGLCVEVLDSDLVLHCSSCNSRWRYGLGYLLPLT